MSRHLEEVDFDGLMTNEEGDIANAEEGSHEENEEGYAQRYGYLSKQV